MSLLLLLAALTPPDRAGTVEQLLFETCPKVIAGEIRLDDKAQLERLGFTAEDIGSNWVGGSMGEGPGKIRLAFKQFTEKRVCDVGFGGPDDKAVFQRVLTAARTRGWKAKEGASELAGFLSFIDPPEASETRVMVLRWPEFLGLKPATSMSLIVPDQPKPE